MSIYVAKVKSVSDVQAAVKFAKDYSLRTRIKGASHDLYACLFFLPMLTAPVASGVPLVTGPWNFDYRPEGHHI